MKAFFLETYRSGWWISLFKHKLGYLLKKILIKEMF